MSAGRPAPAEAQAVQGLVLDDPSRSPVAGAAVTIHRRGELVDSTTTSEVGSFALQGSGEGSYRLLVRHPAYLPYENPDLELSPAEILSLEIRLGANVIPVEPLVVTARAESHLAGFERRRKAGGFGRFLTREQIEDRNASRTSLLLREMGGITLREVGGGRGTLVQMHSGVGLCEPAIYLDGVRSGQSAGSTLDDYLRPDMLDGVEVYTSSSGVPARYAAEACGVVALWTKRGQGDEGEPWSWKKTLLGLGAAALAVLWIT